MKQFIKYSNYYDNIYKNKDYEEETKFLLEAIQKFSKNECKTILSWGCGTGSYEILLKKKGFDITGVDFSEEMLNIAKSKIKKLNIEIDFLKGDVRNIKLNKKFDLVLAMFNIIGYQNTNQDVQDFIQNTARHLNSGGILMLDGWYQPAILKDRPENRIKIIDMENGLKAKRITTQELNIEKSLLNITFKITEVDQDNKNQEMVENHPMRFFTYNEIEYFLSQNGFKLLNICHFKNLDEPISENHWDMFVIAEKI